VEFRDSPEEGVFRASVAEFIERELPAELRGGGPRADTDPDRYTAWFDKLRQCGWVAPAWPKEYGGGGLSVAEQFILNEEMARTRTPRASGAGLGLVGPILISHGNEEQKKRYLPAILNGQRWCQGFSEPGAGSDLASLKTRAERSGDFYVVNGQKIWTSLAHKAEWIVALVRTNQDVPKHKGISCLLIDMQTPGITVMPLVNMAGEHEFNEVFFENVQVPVDMRVGEEDSGWYVARGALETERSGIGAAVELQAAMKDLIAAVKQLQGSRPVSPAVRAEVADRFIETKIMQLNSYNVVSLQKRNLPIAREAQAAKVFSTELVQRIYRTGMRVLGVYGLLRGSALRHLRQPLRYVPGLYLYTVHTTISGGTNEIVRGVVARALGLPRDA
jgi:alkylation response protein AidB-like acyl-CoA dehydrogenase